MSSSTRSVLSLLRIVVLVAALVMLAPVHPGRATDGRDFAGFYDVSNAVDQGNDVQITFAARVFNYSDADVANGTVKLCDSSVQDVSYGTFADVSLLQGQHVVLRGAITLPHHEYDSWQNTEAGGGPSLWIEFTDASGNPIKQRIELVSAPVGEDN